MSDGVHEDGVTRREVLIGAAGGLALAAVEAFGNRKAQNSPTAQVSSPPPPPPPLVFEDRDGSGMSGPNNPGLAGVLVSNGRDVAVTDADGRYTLPLPDEATIFVIKPSGFMPPVDPLDRFAALLSPSPAEGLAGLARPHLRGSRADRRRCPPRSISRCAARTSRRRSKSCCSPIRSRNRRPKSISSART